MLRYIGGYSSFGESKSIDSWGTELRDYRFIRAKGYSTFEQFRVRLHTEDQHLKDEFAYVFGKLKLKFPPGLIKGDKLLSSV